VFDLSAPLEPGLSAAGIRLGAAIGDVTSAVRPLQVHERGDWATYVYESLDVSARHGRVSQLCVKQSYTGKLVGAIGIGSTIADVERILGRVTEDEYDNLIVATVAGWCFETSEWVGPSLKANRSARIVSMCVYPVRSNPG
jgi:hypothetical protein